MREEVHFHQKVVGNLSLGRLSTYLLQVFFWGGGAINTEQRKYILIYIVYPSVINHTAQLNSSRSRSSQIVIAIALAIASLRSKPQQVSSRVEWEKKLCP